VRERVVRQTRLYPSAREIGPPHRSMSQSYVGAAQRDKERARSEHGVRFPRGIPLSALAPMAALWAVDSTFFCQRVEDARFCEPR